MRNAYVQAVTTARERNRWNRGRQDNGPLEARVAGDQYYLSRC